MNILAFGMPSGGELLVIFAILLLVFGAKRLPELARSVGLAKKEFQKAAREAAEEVEKSGKTDETASKSNGNGNGTKKT